MTRDEIDARTGRFEGLQPMEFMKNDTTVSQAAKDIILARKLMPVVLERTRLAFGNDAPIYNAAGLTMFISIMPQGVNRGFRNVDTKDGVLLTVITGGINDRNDIGLPRAIARQIEAVDPNALEVFKTKMGCGATPVRRSKIQRDDCGGSGLTPEPRRHGDLRT